MKRRIIALLLATAMIFSNNALPVYASEFSPTDNSLSVSEISSDTVITEISDACEDLELSTSADNFESVTLIVKTSMTDFNTYGAEDKILIGDNTYLLTYKNEGAEKEAFSKLSITIGIDYVEENTFMEAEAFVDDMQEVDTTEETVGDTQEVNTTEEIVDDTQEVDTTEETVDDTQEVVTTEEIVEDTQVADTTEEIVDDIQETDTTEQFVSDIKTDNNSTIVAVIDTGLDASLLSDYSSRISSNAFNVLDNSSDVSDSNGHGTEIASVLLKHTHDDIEILPIKAMNDSGNGTALSIYSAILYAEKNGADVINLSVNGYGTSKLLENAVNEAVANGITVITSSGNNGSDTGKYMPSNIEKAVTVSAVYSNNKIADYSNTGKYIDFCSYGTDSNGIYGNTFYGTSIACAYVSAVTANIYHDNVGIDTDTCYSMLSSLAADLGDTGWDSLYGNGLVYIESDGENNDNADSESEADTENDSTDDLTDDYTYVDQTQDTILDMPDFSSLSDDEINAYLDNSEPFQIGAYLVGLNDKQYNEILSRSTNLTGDIVLYDLQDNVDSDGDDGVTTTASVSEKYYEFCLSEYEDKKDSLSVSAFSYTTKTGYYTFRVYEYVAGQKVTTGTARINVQFDNLTPELKKLSLSGSSGSNHIWISNTSGDLKGFTIKNATMKQPEAMEHPSMILFQCSVDVPSYYYMKSGGRDIDNPDSGKTYGRLNFYKYDASVSSGFGDSSLTTTPVSTDKTRTFYMQVNIHNMGIGYAPTDAENITCHNTINLKLVRDSYTVKLKTGNGIASVSGAGDYLYGETATINAKCLTGYTWNGWTGSDSLSSQKNTLTITANKTFTATTTENVLKLRFNSNGGSIKTSNSTNTANVFFNTSGNVWYKTNSSGLAYISSTSATSDFAVKESSVKYSADSVNLINVASFGMTKTGYHINSSVAWKVGSPDSNVTITQDATSNANDLAKLTDYIKSGNSTITLYANWIPDSDTEYTVRHFKQNLDGNGYSLADTQVLTGATGDTVKPSVKVYDGFTSPSLQSAKISADGTTVIDYYYTRNSYKMTVTHYKLNPDKKVFEAFATTADIVPYGTNYTPQYSETPTGYYEHHINFDSTYYKYPEIVGWTVTDNGFFDVYYAPNSYSITFDANNGISSYDTLNVIYDGSTNNSVEIPVRTLYTFDGWYTDLTGGTQIYDADGFVTNDGKYWLDGKYHYLGDITLYAHWTLADCVTVFDACGGSTDFSEQVDSIGSTYQSLPTASLTGWDFVGWFTEKNGKGEQVKIGSAVPTAESVTLYAYYTLHPITVSAPLKLVTDTDGDCSFHISADNEIGKITVSVDDSFTMTQINKNEVVTGHVSLDSNELTSTCHSIVGHVDLSGLSSGSWVGKFSINLDFTLD